MPAPVGYEVGEGLREMVGFPEVIALGGAVASAGFAFTFPRSQYTRIQAASFTVVTAAGGGARQVFASLDDPTGTVCFSAAAPATQAGGLTVRYSFANGVQAAGSGALGRIIESFYAGWLPDNMTFTITVTGTAGGDLISAVRLLVDQCPVRED